MNAFLIASLLHDVGHGPLSHVFEQIMWHLAPPDEMRRWKEKESSRKGYFNHEKYSALFAEQMLLETLGEFECIPDKFKDLVMEYIREKSPEEREKERRGLKEYQFRNLRFLLSSQLDVDRLDYIVRDAHFSGVKYGLIDIDRIMWCSHFDPHDNGTYSMSFRRKALDAVQHYLIGRYFMYKNVYMHKKIKAAERHLYEIFIKAKNEQEKLPKCDSINFLRKVFKYKGEGGDRDFEGIYTKLDDAWLLDVVEELAGETNGKLKKLCTDFLERKLWKMKIFICDDAGMHHLEDLAKKLDDRGEKVFCEEIDSSYYEPYNENKNPIFLFDECDTEPRKLTDDDLLGLAFKAVDKNVCGLFYADEDSIEQDINEQTALIAHSVREL